MKSKGLAIFLAIFLGATGVQFFYLGSYIVGTIWLVNFGLFVLFPSFMVIPMFVFALLSLIHAIALLTASDDQFNKDYNPSLVRCGECKEFIQREARKCKHCGATIEPIAAAAPAGPQRYNDDWMVH